MGTVTKRLIGAVGAALVLAGLARRRTTRGLGGGGSPAAGVREPRRPIQPAGSGAAEATPPSG